MSWWMKRDQDGDDVATGLLTYLGNRRPFTFETTACPKPRALLCQHTGLKGLLETTPRLFLRETEFCLNLQKYRT